MFTGRFRHAQVLSDKFAFKVTGEYTRGEEFEFTDSAYVAGGPAGIRAVPEYDLDLTFESLRGEATLYFTPNDDSDIIQLKGTEIKLFFILYYLKNNPHTVKNTLVTDKHQEVLFLGDTAVGKVHDKCLLEEGETSFPSGSKLHQDTGYQGYHPKGVKVEQPKKKPRGKELSGEEKEENRKKSSRRIRVEHSISGVKRLRIILDEIRLWGENKWDQVMEIACGLHNFRVRRRASYQNLS